MIAHAEMMLAQPRAARFSGLAITALGLAIAQGGIVLVSQYFWQYTELSDALLTVRVLEFQQGLKPAWQGMLWLNVLMVLGLWLAPRFGAREGRRGTVKLQLGAALLLAGASFAILLAAKHSAREASGFRFEQLEPPPNKWLQRTEGSADASALGR